MKKKKDDEILDSQENNFEDDTETHMKHKDALLRSLKKTSRINSDLRCLT